MLLIAQRNEAPWWAVALGLGILVVLGVIGLYFFRAYNAMAARSLRRIYDDVRLADSPCDGYVFVHFHTYHGFIAWFSQTEHRVLVAAEDAYRFLNRLLRFNLTWGLLTWGALFVPPLSVLNYIGQRRSVRNQRANGGSPNKGQRQIAVAEAPASPREGGNDSYT